MIKNIYILSVLTFREALSRKIFIFFFIVSSFALLLFSILFLAISPDSFSGIKFNNVAGENVFSTIAHGLKVFITIPLFGGGLFLSIFSVSSFIPQMIEKGSIDLLLSKPISRPQILLGKFIGGTFMVFVNLSYLVLGIWVLIGLKFGDWDPNFLLTIFTITFAFAVLYALVILVGIITKSSIVSMIISYIIFFIVSPILSSRDMIFSFIDSKTTKFILDLFWYITPQTSDISTISSDLAAGNSLLSIDPLIISALHIILILAASIIIFSKKDY